MAPPPVSSVQGQQGKSTNCDCGHFGPSTLQRTRSQAGGVLTTRWETATPHNGYGLRSTPGRLAPVNGLPRLLKSRQGDVRGLG